MFENNRNLEILKGAIGIILGILVLAGPESVLMTIATYVGLLALIAGVILIIRAVIKKTGAWQWALSQGLVNALLGLLIISYPGVTASLLMFVIGLWITFFGILQLIAYLRLKEIMPGQNLSLVSAVLALLVGVLLMFNPFEGAILGTLIFGSYALFYGISRLYIAWMHR